MSKTIAVQGRQVPSFFYGTAWKEDRTADLTRLALLAGFRAIDTANQRKHYFEAAVGQAVQSQIAAGVVQRSELFLQTKFTHLDGQDSRLPYDRKAPPSEQVIQSFASSLAHLGTDYVDSYVLHGPSAAHRFTEEDWQVWQAMLALKDAGKTRLLGVSNVSLGHLESLCRNDGSKPAFVQNRCYARTGWDREVRALCRQHNIVYQGFSLLTANHRALESPTVARIAARTQRTPAQVVFRFALTVGMIPLTGTSDPQHMQQDLESYDFELGDKDVEAIERVEV